MHFSRISFAGSIALASTLSLLSAHAQTKSDPRIGQLLDALGKVQNISQTAISPNGQHLAWVLSSSASEIMLAGPHGENPQRILTTGKNAACSSSSIAFSPDSQKLAFLSDCASAAGEVKPGEGKVTQDDIFLAKVSDPHARAKQLTHLHGYAHEPAWSPDGKQIGILYTEGATRPSGALDAMKPPVWRHRCRRTRSAARRCYRRDYRPVNPDHTLRSLSVYEFDWSPDSKKLAYVAAPPPGENNWWVAKLYTQAVMTADGSAPPSKLGGRAAFDPAVLLDPNTDGMSGDIKERMSSIKGRQIAVPRWSPDGSKIAFICGLMSDQGATGGDIRLIEVNGGRSENITPHITTSPAWMQWTGENTMIFASVDSGMSRVSEGTIVQNRLEEKPLFTLPASIGDGRLELSLSIAKNSTAAFVQTSFDHAPEVYISKLEAGATPTVVTHVNEKLKPSWGKAESITWKNDGFDVQGWLLQPANYDPSKKYPMIVYVHGGPSSAVLPRWPGVGYGSVPFSALGYFVLMPNPRGSYGEGEEFTRANRKDFGYGDFRDVLAGVDAVEKKYPVDDKRLGLTGWSYGGFMTMFGVTQTNRFRAAVAGAGISDWQSYYGENSIDQWMTPFFGATVYDDPQVYAKSSAIDFIKNVKTPTLVVVGDRDGECPAPQSFEFWHALKAEHVPTELVVYPNEGHAFRLPEHRRDVLERALNWFQLYMQ